MIEILSLALLSPLLTVLQVPADIRAETGVYLQVIFLGIFFTFIYNYFACVLRAIGNSAVPLIFLSISSVLNIVLDLAFIIVFKMGVAGAAWATIIAQGVSAGSIMVYCLQMCIRDSSITFPIFSKLAFTILAYFFPSADDAIKIRSSTLRMASSPFAVSNPFMFLSSSFYPILHYPCVLKLYQSNPKAPGSESRTPDGH